MLTKLILKNFKRFENAEIPLDQTVVFVGPNNSGKTTALQALALWDLGARRCLDKQEGGSKATVRTGVTLGRGDLSALPLPEMNLLWRNRRTRRGVAKREGKGTENIRIEIQVEGQEGTNQWRCGLEFDLGNAESIFCRAALDQSDKRIPVPPNVKDLRIAFLPPMSGLSDPEFIKQPGEIAYLVGQGRTADVLRNLCGGIAWGPDGESRWSKLCEHIQRLFKVDLQKPERLQNDQLTLSYKEGGAILDISCSGRGLQQTLLLLAHMFAHPGSIWLLDEPDAHLEFLRQGQTYDLVSDVAQENGCQVIIATHSEKVLNSAAGRHQVVAFTGKPHEAGGRTSQLMKALKDIPFDEYLQAEQLGWVLYVEGSTDLAILRAFAARLNHPAQADLEQVFWKPISNQQSKAEEHFEGLKEAIPGLSAFLLLDRQDAPKPGNPRMTRHLWGRREIENYLCQPATLLAYAGHLAKSESAGPLFEAGTVEPYQAAMQEALTDRLGKGPLKDPEDPFWKDNKVSEEFLPHLLADFAIRLGVYNAMSKGDFHALVKHIPGQLIAPEIRQVLDLIHEVALGAGSANQAP